MLGLRVVTSIGICALAFGLVEREAQAQTDVDSPKRPMPNYDAIGMPDANPDNVGTWIARILLSPLYFTSEFVIRRPLSALFRAAEASDLPSKATKLFSSGKPNPHLSFGPLFYLDSGFFPSVGVAATFPDAGWKRNEVRSTFEIWPLDWEAGSLSDRYAFDERSSITIGVGEKRRPDEVFYGTGYSSLQSQQSRYTRASIDASAAVDDRYWRSSKIHAAVGVRKVDLFRGHFGDDPSVDQGVEYHFYATPYGYNRGYLAPYTSVQWALDTRKPEAEQRSSFRIELGGEEGTDVEHAPVTGWIRYSGSATASFDLNQHGRILSIAAAASFADPLQGNAIPFTELTTLGGDQWMRGYFPGRLVGRSAAVLELRYTWSIAPKLGALLEASVGNVFDAHLDDFRPERLRISGVFGLQTLVPHSPFQMLVGFGSETFEHGAQVDSVRFTIGVPRSF